MGRMKSNGVFEATYIVARMPAGTLVSYLSVAICPPNFLGPSLTVSAAVSTKTELRMEVRGVPLSAQFW